MKLLIVGGGRMGEALLGGLIAAGREPGELGVAEVAAARREELAQAHPGVTIVETPVAADGVLLAVKPVDVAQTARAAGEAGCARVLSVAAGITTAVIEAALPHPLPVVRAMPNTPALIGAGAAAISPGTHAGEADLAWAEEILGAVGVVVRVPEGSLDAVTGLSGSGPAYVFLVAEAMADAGVLAGLPRDVAETLAFQTLLGSARLLAEGDQGPAAAITASRNAARTPARSSSRRPAAVVPPGEVTAAFSAAGPSSLSESSFAEPSRVWKASVSAMTRGRPASTPASAIASATRKT